MGHAPVESLPARGPRSLLILQVADQQYAVETADVAELIPMAELQHPPGAPKVLAGFLNLAGELVPVVRLHQLFGLPEVPPQLWTPLVILRDRRLALWVDSINGTLSVDDTALLPLPSQRVANESVIGVVRSEKLSLPLLSTQRLLLEQENRVIAELQAATQQRIDALAGAVS